METQYFSNVHTSATDIVDNQRLASSYDDDERSHSLASSVSASINPHLDRISVRGAAYSSTDSSLVSQSPDRHDMSQHFQHQASMSGRLGLGSHSAFRRDDDGHSFYTGYHTPYAMESYHGSDLAISSATSGFAATHGVPESPIHYSGGQTLNNNNHGPAYLNLIPHGVITPDLSPQAMSLSPTSDTQWSTRNSMHPAQTTLPLSRPLRSSSPGADNVRKKNAKFEIPEGRNLETIDGLIANSRDEATIRELKAQKRLLKNREAALQSRQRKKQHTEDLEGEKKHFSGVIRQLEKDLEHMKHDKDHMEWQKNSADETVRQLQNDNQMLQQKVSYLETLRGVHGTSSTIASSSSYTDYTEDLSLAMSSSGWSSIVDDPTYTIASHASPFKQDPLRNESQRRQNGQQTLRSNSSLILFMAGAYIAASSSPKSAASAFLSQVSEDIRDVAGQFIDQVSQQGSFGKASTSPVIVHNSSQKGPTVDHSYTSMLSALQGDNSHSMHELKDLLERADACLIEEGSKMLDGQG